MSNIHVQVSDAVITSQEITGLLDNPGHGAQILFSGVVRNSNLGRQVNGVSYDAFAPLTTRTLHEICVEAQSKWGAGLQFHVLHRTGLVQVGEASLLIAVSAPHRDEAYKASRYVIEQIKVRAPIWKKEHYIDGESEWLKGHALCSHPRTEEASP
ncbi:MAG: molybdenum cofactor biosynthesis protein MoaE [Deltaproteobacteria bacterium]|nr:molybdenum cofactor biosynthesis protein MoaE [Deltaproteobacteria bacterium]